MAKIVIFLVLFGLMAIVKGQQSEQDLATGRQDQQAAVVDGVATTAPSTTTLSPEDEALQFNDVVLAIIAGRLTAANLPPEQQAAGEQILADAAEGLQRCTDNINIYHSIWQYKVCASAQLRNALNAIKELQTPPSVNTNINSAAR